MADKKEKGKRDGALKRTLYTIEGGKLLRSRTFCPKCGAGVFLAVHPDRLSCGHCGYTEFKKELSVAR